MRRPPRIPSPGFRGKISAKKDLYATRFVPRESQTSSSLARWND